MRIVKKNHLFIAVLFAVVLAGCSSSKNYYLEPEYQEEKVNSSVTVLPVWRSWFGNFPYYNFGSLSGTGKNVFDSSIQPMFSEYLSSNVEAISSSSQIDTTNFTITNVNHEDQSFSIITPKENAKVSSSRFILLLDQFYFRQKSELSVNANSYAGHEGSEQIMLYFVTNYAYWDTETNKIVGWGTTNASTQISEQPEVSDYSEVLSKTVQKIASQGPVSDKP